MSLDQELAALERGARSNGSTDVTDAQHKSPPRSRKARSQDDETPRLTRRDRLDDAPANESVDGAALLSEIEAALKRYVVFKVAAAAKVLALWVVHTFAIAAADFTPYINITSPEKRSGKSTLLDVIHELAASPIRTMNISEAALYRIIAQETPTTLFDEVDTVFDRKTDRPELRAVLNAGFARGTHAYRCVGEKQIPKAYAVFGPKALSGIGDLPDTLADRALPIRLERIKASESIEKFRVRFVEEYFEALRSRVAIWAALHVDRLQGAVPEPAPGVENARTQDVVEPLLAIADAVGADWPREARDAIRAICTGEDVEDESFGVRLLRAVRAAFDDAGDDRLTTDDLLAALKRDENAPPLDVNRYGSPVSPAHRLAQLLKPYRIKSRALRIGDKTLKGFVREQFEDAWDRYVSVSPAQTSQHRNNPGNTRDSADFAPAHDNRRKVEKSPPNQDCFDVAELEHGETDTADLSRARGRSTERNGSTDRQPQLADSNRACAECRRVGRCYVIDGRFVCVGCAKKNHGTLFVEAPL